MIYRFNANDGSIERIEIHQVGDSLGVIIGKTLFTNTVEISTVFLAMDHQFGDGPPLVFESMIFGETGDPEYPDNYQDRYTTVQEALAGHERLVSNVGKQWVIDKDYRWKPGKLTPTLPIPTIWERLLAGDFEDD